MKMLRSRTVVDGVMVSDPVLNVTAAADAAGVRRSTLTLVVILL